MVANLTVRSLEYTSDLQSHIEIVCHLLLERKPKPPATVCGKPSRWCGQSVQILLNYVGCEARKLPAGGEVFFLDFSFYRANRTSPVLGLHISGKRLSGTGRVPLSVLRIPFR